MGKMDVYWKFAESEQQFNTIQAGIRDRASTWILAAFGAIAILFKVGTDAGSWMLPNSVLIGLVCLMASIGLVLLWINDQLVYHRLLNSVFLLGQKWEFDDTSLPPVKLLMSYSSKGKGMSRWLSLYYIIPMFVFLFISIAVTILRTQLSGTSTGDVIGIKLTYYILIAICIIEAAMTVWVCLKEDEVPTREKAAIFKAPEFDKIFEDSEAGLNRLGEAIRAHKPAPDPPKPVRGGGASASEA